ncbi:MAG: hypothetical protein CM15mV99_180 [Caudoviricetes sp.]|nr:MAG: hypothetical protein CM15mV99_180 [Caudoviricetes sp.]
MSPVAGVGLLSGCLMVVAKNRPDKTRSPLEVTVPVKVGDALVASPRLFASVKSPSVNQPLFELFLFLTDYCVSAHIL